MTGHSHMITLITAKGGGVGQIDPN